MTIDIGTILRHYKRQDVQKEMIKNASDREVVARFGDSFGKRPDILRYPADILELAKQGATSFHGSEELWRNPLLLTPSMGRKDLDELRIGFDLVLDIDCSFIEYSKIAADLVVKALRHHGVKSITIKFSGNKGFHIGVPFESLPKRIGKEETRRLFPEAARRVAFYIKEMIKEPLNQKILDFESGDLARIVERTGRKSTDITVPKNGVPALCSEPFLGIDTLLISSRHLYRMPYSLHEKSGLVSLPIDSGSILEFDRGSASPEKIRVEHSFLDKENVKSEDAKELITQVFSQPFEKAAGKKAVEEEFIAPATALPANLFPPCIKRILEGLEDGRKRALFILINFLSCSGWSHGNIEQLIREWNIKNKEQLREVYFLGQLRYHKAQKKRILPPNCDNKAYYKDMGICLPDRRCGRISNPVNYTRAK